MICSFEGCSNDSRYTTACRFGKELCQKHYRELWNQLPPKHPHCTLEGCTRPTRSPASPYCDVHYCRRFRKGSFDLCPPSSGFFHSNGYWIVPASRHPLAQRRNANCEYEHRVVFYDHHGEGPFRCHVCGEIVTWDDMHVDHLDEVKTNNAIENLAPACVPCNMRRGYDVQTPERIIEYKGQVLTLAQWCQRLGISKSGLSWRLKHWPMERALEESRYA